eukprot:GHRQ01027019.1.p1 GENE.GHRQ01027019.1~~GHRQ01027019.1.p1  ORF type:complete len:136 (+),score=50.03 GHRQ01027019.1:317-724(+)
MPTQATCHLSIAMSPQWRACSFTKHAAAATCMFLPRHRQSLHAAVPCVHCQRTSLHATAEQQGLPLGSGMGSSAASAAAAAWAVNGLFGAPLSKSQLVLAGLVAEAAVSGYHADNIGPALMGGFVLVRWLAACGP